MTPDDLPLLLILAAAALLLDAVFPAQRGRGWNNTRAATQRDVADVLRGKRGKSEPDTTGLLIFLAFIWLLAYAGATP